jgi:hypothetical protein
MGEGEGGGGNSSPQLAALPATPDHARVLNGLPDLTRSPGSLSPAVVEKIPAGLPAPVSGTLKELLISLPKSGTSMRRAMPARTLRLSSTSRTSTPTWKHKRTSLKQ